MDGFMSAKIFWTIVITGGLGGALVAQAQVNSPFASKKKTQAWELPAAGTTDTPQAPAPAEPTYAPQPTYQTPTPQSAYSGSSFSGPRYTPPQSGATLASQSPAQPSAPQSYSAQTYQSPSSAPAYQAPSSQVPSAQASSARIPAASAPSYYQPQTTQAAPATRSPFAPKTPQTYQNAPAQNVQAPSPNYLGQAYQNQANQNQAYQGQAYQAPNYQGQNYQGQNYQTQAPQYQQRPAQKRSLKDRLGLGNLATSLKGFLKIGAAAVRRDSDVPEIGEWDDSYIADGQLRGEVSAITQGGLEYGAGALVRAQYDEFRRGFGGRIGDCPPTVAGCAAVDVAGVATALRGHTSRFFTAGPSDATEFDVALEGAYLFLRSSYGDVTIGRDDGAAYLFSLGAPSLVAVNASNSPVDYTGLDSVKTVNDASGFSEKITYVSPRLLGDRIGVGVQFGASYSLNARACGVDFCVRENGEDGTGVLAPDLDDVFEFGVSLDRTFSNGVSVEATGTYARASEQSVLVEFDDLETFGAGLQVEWNDFKLGGSWLHSNNALVDGDYEAWDVGLSWKPAQWGASLSYGRAVDDSVNLTSDQITLGGVYDFTDRFTLGSGVQYIERTTPFVIGTDITSQEERAIGVFIEGKVTF